MASKSWGGRGMQVMLPGIAPGVPLIVAGCGRVIEGQGLPNASCYTPPHPRVWITVTRLSPGQRPTDSGVCHLTVCSEGNRTLAKMPRNTANRCSSSGCRP